MLGTLNSEVARRVFQRTVLARSYQRVRNDICAMQAIGHDVSGGVAALAEVYLRNDQQSLVACLVNQYVPEDASERGPLARETKVLLAKVAYCLCMASVLDRVVKSLMRDPEGPPDGLLEWMRMHQ